MEKAVSELQGQSGLVIAWRKTGPLSADDLTAAMMRLTEPEASIPAGESTLAQGPEGSVTLAGETAADSTWLAFADLFVQEPVAVQWLASSPGKISVWLNDQRIYERSEPRKVEGDLDRFDAALVKGANRVVVHVPAAGADAQFQLRFRRKTTTAEHERFVQAALTAIGNTDRGRQVFFDAKAQCSKCHRIGNQGERIGPELTGIGNRFSRIHIVESILEPSRTVTPGFQTLTVRLVDGRTASGIRVSESDKSLTLADQKGQKLTFAKDEIEAQKAEPKSTMPDGLAQQLTVEQFRDLVAFLVSQQDSRVP
jgi:putative heme-binding domain-containing protein